MRFDCYRLFMTETDYPHSKALELNRLELSTTMCKPNIFLLPVPGRNSKTYLEIISLHTFSPWLWESPLWDMSVAAPAPCPLIENLSGFISGFWPRTSKTIGTSLGNRGLGYC